MARRTHDKALERRRAHCRSELVEFVEERLALASRRADLGISQSAIAERLGVNQSTISRWERGQPPPDLPALSELADVYGLGKALTEEWASTVFGVRSDGLARVGLPKPGVAAQPDAAAVTSEQERARQILRNSLTAEGMDAEHLAETGVALDQLAPFLDGASALDAGVGLRLFDRFASTWSPTNRHAFLKGIGLGLLVPIIDPILGSISNPSYEIGNRLMIMALEHHGESWESALQLFRTAEKAFGTASGQAPRAACMANQELINLTDYRLVEQDLKRIRDTYWSIMDTETRVDWYRMRGWLAYYLGDILSAVVWLLQCVGISRQAGSRRLAESATHFLGRTYRDWANVCYVRGERERLRREAEGWFDRAVEIHERWGTVEQCAFDHFRRAQLWVSEGERREAQELRDKARRLFGGDLAVLHIDLEEAQLGLEDLDLEVAACTAERSLEIWAQLKYAKGMADAVRILGGAEERRGVTDNALVHYVAALCLYPFENHLGNRALWATVRKLCRDKIFRDGRSGYGKWLQSLADSVVGRDGPFRSLSSIGVNRNDDIAAVLRRIEAPSIMEYGEQNVARACSSCTVLRALSGPELLQLLPRESYLCVGVEAALKGQRTAQASSVSAD